MGSSPKKKRQSKPPVQATPLPESTQAVAALSRPELIAEVYSAVGALIQDEVGRQGRLDTKGSSLLTSVGLSLTVSLAAMGAVVQQHPHGLALASIVTFFVGAIAALVAAFFSLVAVLLRSNRKGLFLPTLLDASMLSAANALAPETAVSEFRRSVLGVMAVVAADHRQNLERKAKWIHRGQVAFGIFMLAMFLAILIFIIGVL